MKLAIFALVPLILSIGIIPILPNIDAEETKTIFIDSHLVDCVGVGPQKCMLVRDNQYSEWSNFYDNIDGFTFVEGNTYQLSVKIINIENPPADASSLKYELLEIITKNPHSIPSWIKTTAEFWINGDVSDQEFVNALQHLVKQEILTIPQSESIITLGESVPNSMKPCTRDYRPVCGLDTVTYSNMCVLENNNAVFSHHGMCVGEKETGNVLFRNVNLFDGTSDALQQNMNVLVEGNMITQVSKNEIRIDHNTAVIEAHGKTLMPGLLDAHTHLSHGESDPLWGFANRDWMYQGATAGDDAEKMLLRGFTTVRDAGGATTGLQKAIDDGRVIGPRILSSGAYISMTSGHGDFGGANQISAGLTGQQNLYSFMKQSFVVDGKDAILSAVRQNMRDGASQIKMMADGGISSKYDPLGVNQFSPEELRTGVEEAERWGTYVLVHAFTDKAVRHAIDAGVKVIDHGPLMTEDTVKLMKEKDIWLSTQFRGGLTTAEEYALEGVSAEKHAQMQANVPEMVAALHKYNVQPAFGSDMFGDYPKATLQSEEFEARLIAGYTSPEIMIQATSHTAKMFELSGERHPYREGPIGVIQNGAYADILIVDGNPLEDASIMGDYEHNIKVIMKDGVIYKNTLN